MSRSKIVAGNWKMNLSFEEAQILANELYASRASFSKEVEVVVCPSSIYATKVITILKDSSIKVGVQNFYCRPKGAYTGEISAPMVASIGATYGIVGHSERRQYFNESVISLTERVKQALQNNITPIYCCGENIEIRKTAEPLSFVAQQLTEVLFELSAEQIKKVVIAYEPIWAIGTGLTASPAEAQQMHAHLRNHLAIKYGDEVAKQISILYGGSCNDKNAKELFACSDVDGGLIGGASLISSSFLTIANSF